MRWREKKKANIATRKLEIVVGGITRSFGTTSIFGIGEVRGTPQGPHLSILRRPIGVKAFH